MDTKQAFAIMVEVTGKIQANRSTHLTIQQSLDIIKSLIEKETTTVAK